MSFKRFIVTIIAAAVAFSASVKETGYERLTWSNIVSEQIEGHYDQNDIVRVYSDNAFIWRKDENGRIVDEYYFASPVYTYGKATDEVRVEHYQGDTKVSYYTGTIGEYNWN